MVFVPGSLRRLYTTPIRIIMSEAKSFVDAKIAGKKVMVFSKEYCPFCKKAKDVFKNYELSADDYEVVEIDNNPMCDAIQDYLKTLTGARSVPRVFINQKCIGGGDETEAMHKSGNMKALLS